MARNNSVLGDDRIDYDAIIIGAGLAGVNALYRLTSRGLRVKLIEAGAGIGGTWYWNTYPGCRVDLESLEYSYDFDPEIEQKWSWSTRYAGQDEVRRYLEWVTDRLDLRSYMQFDTRVASAHFDEHLSAWHLAADSGQSWTARFCVMAVGFLSAAYLPAIPGLKDFSGSVIHSGNWPRAGVDLAGRRVGVIGTGATGVQIVPVIAPQVEKLTVFQRTPNWCLPIRDEGMPAEYEHYVKANYAEVRRLEKSEPGPGCVLVDRQIMLPERRSAAEFTPEEREAKFERFHRAGTVLFGVSYPDIGVNMEVNDQLRDFLTRKIRERVKDPVVAEKLTPKHPPLSRRPPGETNYYETFNRDNVELIDTIADPIVACTAQGVRMASGETHELDVIICATGFDAGVGPYLNMDIRGRGGVGLADHWREGARTHLGVMTEGFPNMFMYNGPQSPCAFFSPFVLVDQTSLHMLKLVDRMQDDGVLIVEPAPAAQERWCEHVNSLIEGTILAGSDGWWLSANIPGKPRQVIAYLGSFADYSERCAAAVDAYAEDFVTNVGVPA